MPDPRRDPARAPQPLSTASTLAIVVPMLNEAAGIEATLGALAPLRAQGVEVIVVDGGSSDDSVPRATPLADRVTTAERGRAQQMNAGAAATSAPLLLFLHADTRLPEHAAALVRHALHNGRHVWGRFDVHIEGRSVWLRLVAMLMNLRSRASGIATGDQAIFVTRVAFDAIGRFPRQPLMEDIELSRRLKRLSPPACLRARVTTSGRRWEQRGVWRTVVLMWRLRWLYWRGVPAEQLAARYR